MFPEEPLPRSNWLIAVALAVLCAVAYLPALDNGFISDDYVILERVAASGLSTVFSMTPERFRITTYLAFGILKKLFGYHAAAFYCFTIVLHFLNAILAWRLLMLATGSRQLAVLGAAIFAVGQSPQEGVMWLAAMNEEWLTLFLQAALILWLNDRFFWSATACVGALFSKESAAVILLLLPLIDRASKRGSIFRWHVFYIVTPVAICLLVLVFTLSDNTLLSPGLYEPGFRAMLVWLISLHRLMFPWLYVAICLWLFARRGAWPAGVIPGLLWMTAALLPYIFLTYQNHVPSRHTYLASIGFAWALAAALRGIRVEKVQALFVAAFILVNIGYLWTVKDRQYEERAAPTSRLVERLADLPPGPVRVDSFPLNPWIAKDAAKLLPGWDPRMIMVNEPRESCPTCPMLRWDPRSAHYQ